jgi:hypothetical protein
MRVEAQAIVAVHGGAAHVHALALQMGCILAPLAKGWFLDGGRIRVRLVWRNRPAQISHVLTVTVRAQDAAA